jgi:predicted TIM-barrel fold metal-dependent hydrolase
MSHGSHIDLSRRHFLQTCAVATSAAATIADSSSAQSADPIATLIDTNISLGQWPFRHHELAKSSALAGRLREQGVTQAWAGSYDALLHKDLLSVNVRLAADCQQHGQGVLVPFGAINPMLPGWEEDLRRCIEIHRMPGIRLHPNYHGYTLADPVFERLLERAEELAILVQISVIMEEERTIHPLVNVPPTDTTPLTGVLKKFPKVRLQLLNAFRTVRGEATQALAALGVRFEMAMLEGVAGVSKLLEQIPVDCLCFGSHAPFFYFESARLKLQESVLADFQMNAICSGNARRLLPIR